MKGEVRGSNQRARPLVSSPLDCAIAPSDERAKTVPASAQRPIRLARLFAPALTACDNVWSSSLSFARAAPRRQRPVVANAMVASGFRCSNPTLSGSASGWATEQLAQERRSGRGLEPLDLERCVLPHRVDR